MASGVADLSLGERIKVGSPLCLFLWYDLPSSKQPEATAFVSQRHPVDSAVQLFLTVLFRINKSFSSIQLREPTNFRSTSLMQRLPGVVDQPTRCSDIWSKRRLAQCSDTNQLTLHFLTYELVSIVHWWHQSTSGGHRSGHRHLATQVILPGILTACPTHWRHQSMSGRNRSDWQRLHQLACSKLILTTPRVSCWFHHRNVDKFASATQHV